MKRNLSILALLMACAMLFAACTETQPAAPAAPASGGLSSESAGSLTGETTATAGEAKAEEDRYGGTATFVIPTDPSDINFYASQGGNVDCQIAMTYSDWLTMYNPNTGVYEGRLLESWEHNEDATEWTMHVRQGVKWHDGVDLTAEDIVFTYEYLRNPNLDIVSTVEVNDKERYEIVDKYTYKVLTDEPNTAELADWFSPMPKHIWENVDPAGFSKAPEGTCAVQCGPYKMTEYKVGEYIRFDRFDDYYGGKPYLDTIYFRVIGDTTSAIAALESGQVDFVTVDATSAETVQGKPGIAIWKGASGNVNRLYFNMDDPRFQDVRVRQAIAHLMQREVYTAQAMRGYADPAYSDWAPTDFYYVGDAYAKYDYSIEKANALLDEAGWVKGSDGVREKDGQRLEFEMLYTSTAAQAGTAMLIMQPSFEQAGIRIIPKMPDDATMSGLWDTHDFVMFDAGTTMGPDPSRYSYIFAIGKENNIMLYEEDDVTELFNKAAAAIDTEEQKKLYEQIQYELADDLCNLPLWYRHTVYAFNDKLNIEEAGTIGYVHFRFLHIEKIYFK